jgi:hypothetical protein
MRASAFRALMALAMLGACSRAQPVPDGPATPSAGKDPQPASVTSSQPAPAARGTLALGEPITSPLVSLAQIAGSPAQYENQVVATGGKVTAVCQAMGCWMELEDESGHAHVKMHGHTFFVPKTAAGHLARVQARVLREGAAECADSPPPKGSIAKVELDATGVELD